MASQPSIQPKVLIIGGGISGLAFANGLQKHSIPFHIYERDVSPQFRAQGYRVRMAGEGLAALRYLVDASTWANFELTCAEMRMRPIPGINALTGKTEKSAWAGRPGGGPPRQRVEGQEMPKTVDRTVLRTVLLKGLKEDSVTYGKTFDRYEENGDGTITAFFEDGSSATGTLIVGADGARSHVRRQRLPTLPILDTGGRCIYGKTHISEGLLKHLCPEIMGGMSAVKDKSQEQVLSMVVEPVIFPKRSEMEQAGFPAPHDYIYWVLVSKPERMGFSETEYPHCSPEEAERLVIRVTESWDPSLKTIFENQQKGETAVLTIDSIQSDFGGVWEPNSRITLIGDAIGLMGPTAGSGAITALRDAHNLCKRLVEDGQSNSSIGKYEEEMRKYTGETVEISNEAGKNIFGMSNADAKPMAQVMEEVKAKRGM